MQKSDGTRLRRRRRDRGFIVVLGYRVRDAREKTEPELCECPNCGEAEAQFVGIIRRAWFTMFFIPLIPLDPLDRAERLCQCLECKQKFNIPLENMARRAGAGRADFSSAIEVYNQLREKPDDGTLLLKLLTIYRQLKEPAEAESAARHFPLAMQAEPRCKELLFAIRED